MTARVQETWTKDPTRFALREMGRAAIDASDTYALREWAAKLATKAGHRDYLGQLRALYDGILQRWRYVMESDEWVPGTADAVIGQVLGAKYNRGASCPDPRRCDIEQTKWKQPGWGDCDDVSALVAAGVRALGLVPYFRVVTWPGGAHVSTLARLPSGKMVSLDPVGHPKHPFGWALRPPNGRVAMFNMKGRPVTAKGPTNMTAPMAGLGDADALRQLSRQLDQAAMSGTFMGALPGLTPVKSRRSFTVAVLPEDTRGPRTLVMPEYYWQAFRRGDVIDGATAYTQFGETVAYDADRDMWTPMGKSWRQRMRDRRKRRRKRRRRRRRKRRAYFRRAGKRIRRGIKRIARKIEKSRFFRAIRKGMSKILKSKFVQNIAAKGLQVFGVPPEATKAALAREAKIMKMGGRARLAKLLAKKKYKKAAKFMKDSFRAAGKSLKQSIKSKMSRLGGWDDVGPAMAAAALDDEPMQWEMVEGGRVYHIAPVTLMEPALGAFGQETLTIHDAPTPGGWYRVKKRDTLVGIAGRAYGVKSSARLKAAQMLNAIEYNARFHRPTTSAFNKKYFGDSIIALVPRYACDPADQAASNDGGYRASGTGCYPILWIPTEAGEEPPTAFEPEPEPEQAVPEPPPEPVSCPAGYGVDPATGKCIQLPPAEDPEDDALEQPITPEEEAEPDPEPVLPPELPEPEPEPAANGPCGPGLKLIRVKCASEPVGDRGELPRWYPEWDSCVVCVTEGYDAPAPVQPPAPEPTPPTPEPADTPPAEEEDEPETPPEEIEPSGPPKCGPGTVAIRDGAYAVNIIGMPSQTLTYTDLVGMISQAAARSGVSKAKLAAELAKARTLAVGQTMPFSLGNATRVALGPWKCVTLDVADPRRIHSDDPEPMPEPPQPQPTAPTPERPDPTPAIPDPEPMPTAPTPVPNPPAPERGDKKMLPLLLILGVLL